MSFDYQPTLKGELVELRPLRLEDFSQLYAVAVDPLIWEQHPVRDRYKEPVFRQVFQESIASGGALTIIDITSGQIIGSSRYHDYDEKKSEVEIGWTFLARSYWGGKYNKQIKDMMLRHAFRYVRSVLFMIGTENYRSQRSVEKIGALRDGLELDSGETESYIYRIKATDYESQPFN